jgi:hypothetical protein
MSTLFPTAYDTFVDPGPNDSISSVAHNLNHGQANDAIAGMQAYVGISSSSGQATLTGQIKALQAQIPSIAPQNFVFAGPASGGAGTSAMRALVPLDIPWLTATAITSSGAITSTTGFVGPLTGAVTGNVTGNVSGSSGSCTGNSATATLAANSSQLLAGTWAIPGAIGSTTPNTGAFTTLTLSGGSPQIQVNAAATNSASIQLNGTTGNDAIVQFAVASTIQQTLHGNTAGWYLNDNVNGWAPIQYQIGAIGVGDVIFNGTRDATSSTSGGVIMSGGLAVAKSLQVGTTITTTNGAISANSTTGNSVLSMNAATGSSCNLNFYVNSTVTNQVITTSTGLIEILDKINNVNTMVYTPGAAGVGYVTWANTLDASSSTVAAFVLSGGLAVAKSLQVGTTITTTNGAITATNGAITTTNGAISANSTTGNSVISMNAATGSNCNLNFYVNSTVTNQVITTSTGLIEIIDKVNTVNMMIYTPGATGAGYVTWANTLDASSSTVAAFVLSGGLAVAKSLQVGTTITTTNGGITARVTAGTGTTVVVDNGTANTSSGIQFNDNSTGKWQIVKVSGQSLQIYDAVNAVTQFTFTPGAIGVGYMSSPLTLDASNSTTAAFVISGGLAVAKSVQVGTTGTYGGAVTATGGFAIPSGHSLGSGAVSIGVRGTGIGNGQAWGYSVLNSASSDTLTLCQSSTTYTTGGTLGWVNNSQAFLYFPSSNGFRIGTTTGTSAYAEFTSTAVNVGSSLVLSVLNTTAASSSTVGAFLVGNGTASTSVAIGGGNINAGGQINGAAVVSNGPFYSSGSASAYASYVNVNLGRGASGTFAANSLYYQSGGGTTAGGGHYFGVNNGTSTNTVMQLTATGFGVFGVTPAAQSTGYGTPTGGAKQASFAASTITLPNLAAAVAQLILDLKAFGYLGT